MKKWFTLLVLFVAAVTSAQAQATTKTYTFDDGVALSTDWDVTTDVASGGVAKSEITSSLSSFPAHDGNFLGLSYLNKGNVGITITTTASYENISEVSIDAVANDNGKPTIAAYIVTETGDVELFAPIGSKDGFATGGTKHWGTKTVTPATPLSGKLKIVTFSTSSGKYLGFDNIKISYSAAPTTAPVITTQPKSAEYLTGRVEDVEPLAVVAVASAGDLTYQWFSNSTESTEGAIEIGGATNASYVPTVQSAGVEYYFCVVTDDNGSTTSAIASITVADPTAPSIEVNASSTQVQQGDKVTLTATATGVPVPTIQWFSNTTESNSGGTAIEGATGETYSPATNVPGTYYYYAEASNSVTTAVSAVQSVTVTVLCKATEVIFSNSFIGFINEPTAESGTPGDVDYVAASNGTVKAYYTAGEEAPTPTNINVNDGSTYAIEGATLTVTASDGVTTTVYDIITEAVTPYDGEGELTFDGTEAWVAAPTGWDATKGWKFQKNADDGRIPLGRTRAYFFVGPAKTITFINGGVTSDRAVKVYVNGQVTTITSIGKAATGAPVSVDIPCAADKPNMIAFVSNQSNGDVGFTGINIVKDSETTGISSASLKDNVEMTNDNAPAYNLAGQQVGKGYKGIVIKNGQKIVLK